MSRLYDTVEPAVIDEDMLQRAVEEQGPKEEAGKIAKEEGITFIDVKSLRLDFKSKFIMHKKNTFFQIVLQIVLHPTHNQLTLQIIITKNKVIVMDNMLFA